MLRTIYRQVAGLDIHKKTVVATRMRLTEAGQVACEAKTLGTTTPELLEPLDGLLAWGISHVAIESTSDLSEPVHNVLAPSSCWW